MNKDNGLYRRLIEEKSEANLKFVGKSIEGLFADEFDRIALEAKDIEIPEQLDRKLDLMLREGQSKRKRREHSRRFARYARVSAFILAAVLVSGSILVLNVEAFRAKVFEIFFHERPNYVEFKPIEIPYDEDAIIPINWEGFWYPSQLPDGFVLANYTRNGQAIDLIFKNDADNRIYFSQVPTEELNLQVDNADQDPEIIKINSGTAYWTSSEDNNLLMWDRGEIFFILQSELPKESMVQIAENIAYYKK